MENILKRLFALVLLPLSGISQRACAAPVSSPAPHTFGMENGKFARDGKPFRIISGEMHSPRIHD
jgi:beta-galactosidase